MDARASGTICGRAAKLRRAAKIYGWTANGAYADRIMTKDFFAGFGFAGRAAFAALALVCAAAFPAARAEALTQAEAAPVVFEALGRETPEKFLSAVEGDMTRRDALRFAFEAMGWGFALAAVDQIGILPEWPEVEGVSYISATMSPQPPAAMTASLDEPLLPEDMEEFENWLRECAKSVSWKASFSWNGTTLFMVKRGVGDPSGSANGDMENGRNEPLFAAALAVDMAAVPCQIATAEMIGSKRAALATIAVENYGVIGGINGGYFSGAKPIGVLRRQGRTDNAKFWPNRSAFGWNESGEFIFIDGKIVNNIGSVHEYDEYTEMMQAGPLLVKEGEAAPNTEDVDPAVLNRRHPRTFVGTDGSRVVWGIVDGRDNMHSVGMTIEELRTFCIKGLALTDALNLDGGGSSSIWWRGMTFSQPSNDSDVERPIPYAVLMFEPGAGVRQ